MNDIPLWRRCIFAGAGLVLSAWILRAPIAGALVARGDEYLYRSDPRGALRYYGRATAIDSNDALAIDRYLFDATALRDRSKIEEGIARAGSYLRAHPHDDTIRMDRAMALRVTGRLDAAMNDFARVGAHGRDVRALTFAGLQARALGRAAQARHFWKQALTIDPRFAPARRLLGRPRPSR